MSTSLIALPFPIARRLPGIKIGDSLADIVTPAVRSRMMSNIRGKNTTPELRLRKGLWKLGFRFRLHAKLPGTPDLVLPKWRTAIFVHGCFWHAHDNCRLFRLPSTRTEFWQEKLLGNRSRDVAAMAKLRETEWKVIVVWECALRTDVVLATSLTATAILEQSSTNVLKVEQRDGTVELRRSE